ncbi:acyltransferase [Candidatus Saccharibacteria bacterium]|nr:acyltransferase [Candidatus Saccharibacteria bacterium]
MTAKSKSVDNKPDRIIYFDILNVFAIICVVFLHHNGIVHGFAPTGAWAGALAVEVLAFFAVPIFLMLTGATLMEYRKRYDTKTFFKKRLMRIFIPFIFWMLFYFVWHLLLGDYEGQIGFHWFYEMFMFTKMNGVFWFFPMIIAIYLALPVLSLLTEPKHRKGLWYLAGVGFLTYSLLPPLLDLFGLKFNTSYALPLTGAGFIIFPIIGYLLSTAKKIPTKWFVGIIIAAVGCLILRYCYTYFMSYADGVTNRTLFSYTAFTGVVPAVAIFLITKKINFNKIISDKIAKVITRISSASFGVYLLHVFIMHYEQGVTHLGNDRLLWRLIVPFMTYIICVTVVLLVKKIPILRNIFP